MSEKQLRIWIALGFGAIAAYYFFKQHAAATQLATIQPVSPDQLATPTALQSIPQLRPSIMS